MTWLQHQNGRFERNFAKTLPDVNFEDIYWHSCSSNVSLFGTIHLLQLKKKGFGLI